MTTPEDHRAAYLACTLDPAWFTARYVAIYDAMRQAWLPFTLWPAQHAVLATMAAERKLVVLKARLLVERNNHGQLVLRELQQDGRLRLLDGYDKRPGWLSNVKGKPLLYGLLAAAVKDQAVVVRDTETANQLASIEASTLRAPSGLHNDRADAFALAVAGLAWRGAAVASSMVEAGDPLGEGVGW